MSEDPTKTNLLELVAQALNGSLGQDRVQSLMEALHLFENDGGTEGLVAIAKSKGISSRAQRRALELLFSKPPNETDWAPQPEAYDLAAYFVSGETAETQRETIEVLNSKVTDTASIPSQIQEMINDLAVKSQDPRTRKVAQEFILLMLHNETSGLSTTRTALQVRLNEPDTIQRLQFGEQSADTLTRAVERHHGGFSGDDWELLAKAGRELGVLPANPVGPSLWWRPSLESRRAMRSDLGLLGFVLPCLAALLMALVLGFIIRPDAQLNLTLPLYYGLISTVAGGVLGVLCMLAFQPISLFSYRKRGAILQSAFWIILMALIACLAVFLMSVYMEDRSNPVNRGFWESFAILTIALALVRPVTLAAYRLGGQVRRRRFLAVLCGTVISLGVLMLGVRLALEDGQTLELQALFFGGPIVAAAATVFAMLDNYRPDRAAETTNTTGFAMISGATLAGFVAIFLVIADFVQSPATVAAASERTVERLVHLGTKFPLPVPVRQTIKIESQQDSAAMSADIEASDGLSLALNVTQEETRPLSPDVYDVCVRSRVQNCAAQADIPALPAWRLLMEVIDARLSSSRITEDKSVPTDFERITITHDMSPPDRDTLAQFNDLRASAELGAQAEDGDFNLGQDDFFDIDMDETLQYFLATQDAVIGTGTSSLRVLGGSLVVRTIHDTTPRLTLVDGLALRDGAYFSLPYVGLAVTDFVELGAVDADTLGIIERYLDIARNERLHLRLDNPTLKSAVAQGLEHLGGLNPDQITRGRRFLSTAQASDTGAGLFEIQAVLDPPSNGAAPQILARMLAGWSRVPSSAFCYRFPADKPLLLMSQGAASEPVVNALQAAARESGADEFFLDQPPLMRDIDAEYCPAFDAPQSISDLPILENFAVSEAWSDQVTLWLQTQDVVTARLLYEDGIVEFFDFVPNEDDLAGLDIKYPEGDLVAMCFLDDPDGDGCDELTDMQLAQMQELPDPQDGNILNFSDSSAIQDAKTIAQFETTFLANPPLADTNKIGVALGPMGFLANDIKVSGTEGGQRPILGLGSLIEVGADPDKATVLLGLYPDSASAQPDESLLDFDPEDVVYLDDSKVGEEFDLVLEYMRATARATNQDPPSGEAIEAFYDSVSAPVLARDTVIRVVKSSGDSDVIRFESAREFNVFAKTANDPSQAFASLPNTANNTHTFSFRGPPIGIAQSFCFADARNSAPCERLTGFNDPVLMRPAGNQAIDLQIRNTEPDITISSGQVLLNASFRLDRWPTGASVTVLSDRDIVIKPYYANVRTQSVIDEDGIQGIADAGEEFEPTDMVGFCAMEYGADITSCPDTLAEDALSILPESGTSNIVRTTDRIRALSQRLLPGQVFLLGEDWQGDVNHSLRAQVPFEMVLRFEEQDAQVLAGRLIAGSYEANLLWADGRGPTALCVRLTAADPSCSALFERPEVFDLEGRESLLVRSESHP